MFGTPALKHVSVIFALLYEHFEPLCCTSLKAETNNSVQEDLFPQDEIQKMYFFGQTRFCTPNWKLLFMPLFHQV